MNIRTLWKKVKKNNYLKEISPYIEVSKDSYLGTGQFLQLRNPKVGKQYLKMGSHCMINGQFIFETEEGYVEVGDRCYIGEGTAIICRSRITIEDDVTIAWGCTIYDHNSHSVFWDERKNDIRQAYDDYVETGDFMLNKDWSKVKSAEIIIKSKAWLGFGVTILKGVTIGEGAVVAAKSVVVKDVLPYTVVGGNPAVLLKTLN